LKICRPILPIRFDRMYERDRQTDTDTHRMTANAALDMLASRGKTGSEYRPYQMTFSRDRRRVCVSYPSVRYCLHVSTLIMQQRSTVDSLITILLYGSFLRIVINLLAFTHYVLCIHYHASSHIC